MDGEMTKRKYELKQRAAEMAETRRRITEAAVELHGSVGPAKTTWSAIAERAGVRRHTVYRHFATDEELYRACSSHYRAANPWPDQDPWRAIRDPHQRLTRALDELYAHYERTEHMFTNVFRDLDFVEVLEPTIAPVRKYLADAAALLASGWGVRGRRRRMLDAAVAHGIDFQTWRSLARDNHLSRTEAVQLVTSLVEAAAASPAGRDFETSATRSANRSHSADAGG
jgi:AcrR family transcriptional regulator